MGSLMRHREVLSRDRWVLRVRVPKRWPRWPVVKPEPHRG